MSINTKPNSRTNKIRFAGYMRVSRDKEETGSFTFETQEQRIREKLNQIYGEDRYTLKLLSDNGLSGSWGFRPTPAQPRVRPALCEVVKMVENDEVDGVIVYDQNRLFRDLMGLTDFIYNILKPKGKILLSSTDDIDIESLDSMFMVSLRGVFHQRVREDIVKRNKDAAASRAEQGYPIGQVGYGWVWESQISSGSGLRRGIIFVEEEKHWVLHIKDRYLSGWNAVKIAGELNDLEVPSPLQRELWSSKAKKRRTRDGREPRWTNGTVWGVLRNPLHAGLIKLPKGERIKGKHYEQRFWEPEELDQIEQAHEERNRRFKTCSSQKDSYHLLSGMIYCNRCGQRLYMSSTDETSKNYRSYKCTNGAHEGKLTCPGMTVRAQWVEDAVVEEIARLSKEPVMRRLLETEVKQGTSKQDENLIREKRQLTRKSEQIGERFERWAEGFSKGLMTEKQFAKYSKQIEVEESEVNTRLTEIDKILENKQGRQLRLVQVQEQLKEFPTVWEHLDNDEKRQVLSLLIEEKGLKADRDGRDIVLKIKVPLLPEQERHILYRSFRGINRTTASGVQRLTLRQMVLLHYAGQSKSRTECAELMGCKVHSIYSIEKVIRKNLGSVSWKEAVEMARERVEANVAQLPLGQQGRNAPKKKETVKPFISPVLMEVFELFANGATVPEVAERLGLSAVTVQGRRSRILKLMGISSMLEAVERAREMEVLK